jgi:glutathione synthase
MMSRPIKMGFLMDPIERILPDKDTTFVFMLEAGRRGHQVLYFTPETLFTIKNEPHAYVRAAVVKRAVPHYEIGEAVEMRLRDLDVLFMRVDPPFTLDYLTQTYFLDFIEDDVFVINRPQSIRDANEKLFTLHFPELVPPTIITNNIDQIRKFQIEVGGEIVLKPIYGCGGAGVFAIKMGDRNTNVIIENMTNSGATKIIAQKYVPEVRLGDKRIIMLNGEAIGATARVPKEEENRANIHVGGTCIKNTLTERDKYIAQKVGAELKKRGLYFVGLDVLGDWLTEINVTSPTGVQEIDRLDNVCLEARVIDFVEKRIGSGRK